MKKLSFALLTIAALFFAAPVAKANSYDLAFVGTAPPSADALLVGNFAITTNAAGIATGGTITLGDSIGSFVAGTYNLTFGGFLSPTFGEFVFTGAGGTIDLFDVNGTWQIEYDGENTTNDALEITPEPSSLMLLGTGLLLLAGGLMWKSRTSKNDPVPNQANGIQVA